MRLDLPFPHQYIPSSTPGHGHLYLPPVSRFKMFLLLFALYKAGVVEKGFFLWSMRRGGTFVRRPGVAKSAEETLVEYSYGFIFPVRRRRA